MAKFNEKISTILNAQLPEFIVADHPKFADFLKSYYQLLESAELKVKDVETTVGVLIETETGQENNLVYDATRIGSAITNIDEGDKILLEETTYGKFTVGETVKGLTSGAEAKVLSEDLGQSRLFISSVVSFATLLGGCPLSTSFFIRQSRSTSALEYWRFCFSPLLGSATAYRRSHILNVPAAIPVNLETTPMGYSATSAVTPARSTFSSFIIIPHIVLLWPPRKEMAFVYWQMLFL